MSEPTPGKDTVEQWGALPEEPCRVCHRTGGVLFLIDEDPYGRADQAANGQVVRCSYCGNSWYAGSSTAG